MKKLSIGCLSIIGILFLIGIIAYFMYNQSLPKAKEGAEADALAQQMLTRLDKPAFDTLKFVSWSFMDKHHYIWDKVENDAVISWESSKVILDLDELEGRVFEGNEEITDDAMKQTLIAKAWNMWCNDSFWFYAPYKIFDKGTTRSIVETTEADKALLISYKGGGVTPGDSYLWLLDDTAMPFAYKMWVSILPIGGIRVEWTDWIELYGGAMVAQNHPMKLMNVKLSNINSGQTLESIGHTVNPFE